MGETVPPNGGPELLISWESVLVGDGGREMGGTVDVEREGIVVGERWDDEAGA